MASAALSGPTVRTVTVLSPDPAPALSVSFRPASIAYSSSSESRPSTPNRSVVMSDSLNVRSDWASGTYLTQTTMFIAGSSSSLGDYGLRFGSSWQPGHRKETRADRDARHWPPSGGRHTPA